jgi:hypothetical protein
MSRGAGEQFKDVYRHYCTRSSSLAFYPTISAMQICASESNPF